MSAETCRDALQQSLIRLSNRLTELSAWRDRECIFLSQGEIRLDSSAAWTPIKLGDYWPAQGAPVEIRFAGVVPNASWNSLPVRTVPWPGNAGKVM